MADTLPPAAPVEIKKKDVGTAGVLALIFGPFGLFYLGGKYVLQACLIFIALFALLVILPINMEGLIDDDYLEPLIFTGLGVMFVVNIVFACIATGKYNKSK